MQEHDAEFHTDKAALSGIAAKLSLSAGYV
jgi:hypothetical protein